MSTLGVVEEILREVGKPVSVREIVEQAGSRLPTKSKTPDTVVARDLSMDLKKKGESSLFVRTSPGRYTLRVLAIEAAPAEAAAVAGDEATPVLSTALADKRAPAKAAPARGETPGSESSSVPA